MVQENITGPVNGFWIAAYAAQGADGRWCSYAKVCTRRPASYWGAPCLFKLFGGEDHESGEAALARAHQAAASQVARIPVLEGSSLGFAMFDESHQIVFPLAQQLRRRSGAAAAAL